jgi:transmembrane sensor
MEEELYFKDLVIKFLAGEISESEAAQLKSLLARNATYRRFFNSENELWQKSAINQKSNNIGIIDEGWTRIHSKIANSDDNKSSLIIIEKRKVIKILAAASIIFLVMAGGYKLMILKKQSISRDLIVASTVATDEGEKAHIYLSDSTEVILNSGSSLKYDPSYNMKERKVQLSGEAYFKVHTNREKPFLVQLENMTIAATGTRFNVLSYNNENRVETTLEEGKIHILFKNNKTIDLKPGDQVLYFNKTKEFILREVQTETYTSWKENKLRLIDTPIEEAFRKIARRYNVVFEIQGSKVLDLKYTATFIDESVEEVMQMLKTVSPISYKIYNSNSVDNHQYLKPKIVVWERKPNL